MLRHYFIGDWLRDSMHARGRGIDWRAGQAGGETKGLACRNFFWLGASTAAKHVP